jgi:peptide-methionine (R)-S-oxide reductase
MSTEPTDDAQLRARLTPLQYSVTQKKGSEPAFSGKYAYSKDAGVYSCVCCGQQLFSSDTKFDSGSGWASFWQPLAPDRVRTHVDNSHGMSRTEVICGGCGAHLGHEFDDGPNPCGLRYCINSAALGFSDAPKP